MIGFATLKDVFSSNMAVQNGEYYCMFRNMIFGSVSTIRLFEHTDNTHGLGGVYKPNLGGILWRFPMDFPSKPVISLGNF